MTDKTDPAPVTPLDLAALGHQLRLELAQVRTALDDVLAAHRAALTDVWEKLAQLEGRLARLEKGGAR
jgi:hypothetical protein